MAAITVPGLLQPPEPLIVDSGSLLNAYTLVGKIGEGATSKVYEGLTPDGTRVAIKVFAADTLRRISPCDPVCAPMLDGDMPPPMTVPARPTTYLDSVRDELRLLERLSHTNVVRSLGTMTSTKKLCVVMPLLEKPLLSALPSSDPAEYFVCKPVPLHIVSAWAHDLLEALRYLHEEVLVSHGDISHNNICLDSSGRAVVVDFGCFKPHGTLRHFYGSIAYSSPESTRGGLFHGAPADVWALGIVLCTALAGRPPFSATIAPPPGAVSNSEQPTLAARLTAEISTGRAVLPLTVLLDAHGLTADTPAAFLDLLGGLLHADPTSRLSASCALSLPWWEEQSAWIRRS
jgi:serine/threonine protein kinase